jgi:hypothetical protein
LKKIALVCYHLKNITKHFYISMWVLHRTAKSLSREAHCHTKIMLTFGRGICILLSTANVSSCASLSVIDVRAKSAYGC